MSESVSHLNLQKMGSLMGAWIWDLSTNRVQWSRNLYTIFGLDSGKMHGADLYQEFFKLVHPDDIEAVNKANSHVRSLREPISLAFRIIMPDGRVRHIISEPDAMLDDDGHVVTMTGIIRDQSWENKIEQLLLHYKSALDEHSIVAVTDKSGCITYVNDKACEISGYSRSELIGQNHRILNSGYHTADFFRHMYTTIYSGNVWRGEICNRKKDGTFYWVETTIVPFGDGRGEVAEFLAIRTDITIKNRNQKILLDTSRRLAEAQRLSKTGSWEWIPETGKVFWSDEMFRIFNISPQYFDGSTEASINAFHPDDRAFVAEMAQRALQEKKPQPLDARVLLPDGSVRYVHGEAEIEFDSEGNVSGMQGTYQDITERVLGEKALEQANQQLNEAQRISHIGSWEWHPAAGRVYFSAEQYRLFALTPQTFDGKIETAMGYFHPEDHARANMLLEKALREKKAEPFDARIIRADGQVRHVHIEAQMEFNDKGELVRMYGTHQDITDRLEMELALRESRESYQRLFEQTGECLFISDQKGHYLDVNAAAIELTGYSREELLAMSVRDLFEFSGENKPRFAELKAGWALSTERTLKKKNGDRIQTEIHARMLSDGRFFATLRDLTPQRQLEQSLLQTQKLESLAVLAGGISHDFNNLLSGMFGYAELAKKLSADERITHYLRRILEGLERSQSLTQRLLTFASGGQPRRSTGHLFPHVRDTVTFALSGSNCRAHFDIAEEIYPCEYDPVQIAQVFDNLVRNAQQAMPDGGLIMVSAQNEQIPEGGHAVLQPGDYVRVSVTDMGHGIPEENLGRLFDPFFSTKPNGHGLGLASSYSIVRRHGGLIEAASTPGKGSVFHVLLPAAPDAVVTGPADDRPETPTTANAGIILVMDDEELVRESITALLQSMGYNVIAVEDGKAAIEYHSRSLVEQRLPVAIILDLTIPGSMGGKEVVAEMRKIDKVTPIFVSSGYSEGPIMSDPGPFGFNAALPKPVRAADLVALLNKYLGKF